MRVGRRLGHQHTGSTIVCRLALLADHEVRPFRQRDLVTTLGVSRRNRKGLHGTILVGLEIDLELSRRQRLILEEELSAQTTLVFRCAG